jgi:hypothetical protein
MKVGQMFPSKIWLDPQTNQPLQIKITRIASGVVYYRPYYGLHDDGSEWLGSSAYFPLDQADRLLTQ